MKNKIIKTTAILFLLSLCANIDAQTVIRENVRIRPEVKAKFNSNNNHYSAGGLGFTVSWKDTVEAWVLVGGNLKSLGRTTEYSDGIPANATGDYAFQIRLNIDTYQSSKVKYFFFSNNIILSYGSVFLQREDCCPAWANIECSFIAANDFFIEFRGGTICNSRMSSNIVPGIDYNYDQTVIPLICSSTPIDIQIKSGGSNVEVFNRYTNEPIIKPFQLYFKDLSDLGVRLLSQYNGNNSDTVWVTVIAGELIRTGKLIVEGAGSFSINESNQNYSTLDLMHGMQRSLNIYAESTNFCEKYLLPNSIAYNVAIVKGINYGILRSINNGSGSSLSNIAHSNGQIIVDYLANGIKPTTVDTIIIRVSTTDINITPLEIQFIIHPQKINVTIEPTILAVGDTANIILKKIIDNDLLEDFSTDQMFEYQFTEGLDYGTFFISDWGSTTNYFVGFPNQIKFVAVNGISDSVVTSKILVKTSSGMATKIVNADLGVPDKSKNYSKVFKAASILEDNEQLWGEGVVKIGNAKTDTFFVKASFDKQYFSAGDTLNINFVRVNKDGTESKFPENTLYEARVDEGCKAGQLYASGKSGFYLDSVSLPIRFIVNDSLVISDSIISVKIGVPSKDINTYKLHQSELGLQIQNVKSANKLMNLTSIQSGCSQNEFHNTLNADAVAKRDDAKVEIVFIGDKTIWPYKTGGNSKTNIKVNVTKGGQPFVGQNVKIGITRIEGTGGHDHVVSPLPIQDCGKVKINGIADNPNVHGITNNNGEVFTEGIISSEFGGEYKIKVSLLSSPNIKNEESFTVKVPGLELLPSNNFYDPIGGTEWHLGPPKNVLDHNHWGVNSLIRAIIQLSSSWYGLFSNVPKLQINDMSLPYGGKFDCFERWKIGHSNHRIGENVDIQSSQMQGERFYDKNRNGWYDQGIDSLFDKNNNGQFDAGQLGVFRNIAFQKNFGTVNYETDPVTKQPHWHLDIKKRGSL